MIKFLCLIALTTSTSAVQLKSKRLANEIDLIETWASNTNAEAAHSSSHERAYSAYGGYDSYYSYGGGYSPYGGYNGSYGGYSSPYGGYSSYGGYSGPYGGYSSYGGGYDPYYHKYGTYQQYGSYDPYYANYGSYNHYGSYDPYDPYAYDPYAHDPYAHDPYAHDPYAHDPYAHDPYAYDPYASYNNSTNNTSGGDYFNSTQFVDDIIESLDTNKDGKVSAQEFHQFVKMHVGEGRQHLKSAYKQNMKMLNQQKKYLNQMSKMAMNHLNSLQEDLYAAFTKVSEGKGYMTAEDLHKYLPYLKSINDKYNM